MKRRIVQSAMAAAGGLALLVPGIGSAQATRPGAQDTPGQTAARPRTVTLTGKPGAMSAVRPLVGKASHRETYGEKVA
jgi:hypothetical protein